MLSVFAWLRERLHMSVPPLPCEDEDDQRERQQVRNAAQSAVSRAHHAADAWRHAREAELDYIRRRQEGPS
jgi:hypothetical protein